MKKTVLYVGCVFIVAFLLGMLTSAQIRNKKLEPVRTFFSERDYVRHIGRIVHPTKEQWEDIESIMNKYGEKNTELQKTFSDGVQSNMEAFRKEIDQILTKEQREQIKQVEEERKKMYEEFMKSRSDSISLDREKNSSYRQDRDRNRQDRDFNRQDRDRNRQEGYNFQERDFNHQERDNRQGREI